MMMVFGSVSSILPLLVALLALCTNNISALNIHGLHVDGNKIKNQDGEVLHLRGVDRSGTEFACIQGWGIFDGPNNASSVQEIRSWNVSIVRVPLNEDCWLGINGVKPQYSGSAYQKAIYDYVILLNANNMAVILDLHWNAPGSNSAKGQQPMPDADHAVAFWQSVASTFKNNTSVIFDIYNEPYPDNGAWDSTEGWTCWRDGGKCNGIDFEVAGMQKLVDAVRATGATNICMLGGLQWSNSLTQWLKYRPHDPTGNLAASWHSYNFNHCNNQQCWDQYVAPVAAQVPVITGEFGTNDCGTSFVDPLMKWMDSHGIHYLAWTWNTWGCNSGPCVIDNYDGHPTASYGQAVHDHYLGKSA